MSSTVKMTAIIQFIGIVLFTRDVPPDHRLNAIMPRISGHVGHEAGAERTVKKQPQVVEEHAAFIAFPAADYLGSNGWPPVGLETARGYLFVRLDGEHVTFRAGGRVATTEKPVETARFEKASGKTLDPLGLPHLGKCCKGAKLKPQFQPPFSGAAAVFDLSSLKAKGCRANSTDPNVTPSRIDSRAYIENDGVLVIAATKKGEKKEIWLHGKAVVIVGNMPRDVITGKPTGGGTAHHYQAYYDMLESTGCSKDYRTCAVSSETPDGPCEDKSIIREALNASPVAIVLGIPDPELPWWASARTDFECSNTQWP